MEPSRYEAGGQFGRCVLDAGPACRSPIAALAIRQALEIAVIEATNDRIVPSAFDLGPRFTTLRLIDCVFQIPAQIVQHSNWDRMRPVLAERFSQFDAVDIIAGGDAPLDTAEVQFVEMGEPFGSLGSVGGVVLRHADQPLLFAPLLHFGADLLPSINRSRKLKRIQ